MSSVLPPIHCCYCCCSVAKSRLILRDPMDCSTPGSSVPHFSKRLLKLVSIESVMLSKSVIFCCPLLLFLPSFPASGSFPMNRLFPSDGQSIGVSATASVLPMIIQDSFPLGLTDLISLLSKRLSSVFSSTTIQKHQFFGA